MGGTAALALTKPPLIIQRGYVYPAARFTRYTTTATPPPSLAQICVALQAAMQTARRGYMLGKGEIRAIARRINRKVYDVKSCTDHFTHFLVNTQVLIEGPVGPNDRSKTKVLWFDKEQAQLIIYACEVREAPVLRNPEALHLRLMEIWRESLEDLQTEERERKRLERAELRRKHEATLASLETQRQTLEDELARVNHAISDTESAILHLLD